MKKIYLFIIGAFALAISACNKDYLETYSSTAVTQQQVFAEIATIKNSLVGTGKQLFAFSPSGSGRHDDYGQKSVDLQMDIMANDMVVHAQGYGWYNRVYQYTSWAVPTDGAISSNTWYYYYDIVKQVNQLLGVVDDVADATSDDKAKIKGQLLGYRAYCYYFLINLWQQTYKGHENSPGVPLYLGGELQPKGRGTVKQVYDQIIADLTTAESFLDGKDRNDVTEINVDVIRGFRARVALLQEDWATAEQYAHKARQSYVLFSGADIDPVNNTSLFSSIATQEWMWGALIPEVDATYYASYFSHMDINTGGYASLGGQKKITKALYDSIPDADARKKWWTAPGTWVANGSDPNDANVDYNQVKHEAKDPSTWDSDYLFMRASEMYLIEAEALARQGNEAEAQNVMRELIFSTDRNPTYDPTIYNGQALINHILLQRRIELWGEGFSLIDIKRLHTGLNRPTGADNHWGLNCTGKTNYNPILFTTGDADSRFLMRIPQKELDNNSAMSASDQNP